MQGDDVSEIRRLSEDLKRIAQQIGSMAYNQNAGGPCGTDARSSASPQKEDVVDAEFEEVA
jgi:hypothetical protein